MSQNIFNLYSATLFAEHPSAMWNLDDDVSYISLISASPTWIISGGSTYYVENEPNTSPVDGVGIGDINLVLNSFITASASNTMEMFSQTFLSPDDIDLTRRTAGVSTYFYPYSSGISKIEIGVRYRETPSGAWVYDYSEYENISTSKWIKVSHSFKAFYLKNQYAGEEELYESLNPNFMKNIEFQPYLKIYASSGVAKTFSIYNFCVGQWLESYSYSSPGVVPTNIENISASSSFISSIPILTDNIQKIGVVEADAYGLSSADTGYYFSFKNKLLAENSGLPMVFGSPNVTEIIPIPGTFFGFQNKIPAIAFPGNGFLHESGKYKELTAEFWLRINPKNIEERRIFGNLNGQDGLYVDQENLILKVGHKKKKYFIGKWYRPMLIDIRYNPLFISVLINGDVVISTEISPLDTIFPDNSFSKTDWVCFYGDQEIGQFEIDCFAIYPYIVPEQVAKRRFVYGQGVGKSEEIAKRFSGIALGIDFPFADYTYNLIYPDMSKWDSGFYSNINANSRVLSLPEYSLPEIRYVGDDLQPFQLARVRRSWLGLKETSIWSDWRSGVWRAISQTKEANTLVDNYDSQSERTSNFYIKLTPNSVYEDLYGSIDFNSISQISENVASIIGLFSINRGEFQDVQNDSDKLTLLRFVNRATGDFIDVSLNKENENNETIDYYFNNTLIEQQTFSVGFDDKYFAVGIDIEKFSSSYSSIIRNFFQIPQNIALSVAGQDKNEFPGKVFKVIFNNRFFTNKDLSDYFRSDGAVKCTCSVTPNYFENLISYIGNYTLIFDKANSAIIMDIASSGYWEDSVPLSQFGSYIKDRSGNTSYYDLDAIQFNIDYPSDNFIESDFDADRMVNTFLTIQRFNDVGTINYTDYSQTKNLDGKRYIDLDDPDVNLDITKFRIVDGVVIFPPKSKVDFKDAYITIHVEIKSSGTSTSPIKIQRMSLSSIAFDQTTFYELGTPTGNKFYPFTRQGASYTNKIKNPFLIYKDSTPYLYLTGDSGLTSLPYPELEESSGTNFARGLSIAINDKKQEDFLIYGFSFWTAYNRSESIDSRQRLFSIYSVDQKTNFYISPEIGNKRGKIESLRYEISGETLDNNVTIYQNGIDIDPYIKPMSWSFITVKFDEPMSFNESIGQLEFYPGIIFNNVTLYTQSIDTKVDDIFESYLGLSNVVAQDSSTLSVNSDGLDLFNDVQWTIFSGKPV